MLTTESTLTLDKLTDVLDCISNAEHVASWLAITPSKQFKICERYGADSSPQIKRAYWDYFLTHHPAPCWKIVAVALWRTREFKALEVVQKMKSEPIICTHYYFANLLKALIIIKKSQ